MKRFVLSFSLMASALFVASSQIESAESVKKAGENWWSLKKIERPTPPELEGGDFSVRNPIDAFIFADLIENGLKPSPEADRPTLIRRLTFNLIGLPPTPDEIAAFLKDESPDSYEKLVERLLASPHYGERWARHWLDVVRFGESHGFEYNQPRQNAWHYRNWIVDALNRDMPYDQFARWQLAGDALAKDDPEGVIATGFLVAGPHNTTLPASDPMKKTMRQDEMEDTIAAVGQTFLALTINCARCHDHKFDPISQRDYYRIAAALAGVNHGEKKVQWNDNGVKEEIEKLRSDLLAAKAHLDKMEAPVRDAILKERQSDPGKRPPAPDAFEHWDFTKALRGEHGKLDVELHGGATQGADGLRLDGDKAYGRTGVIDAALGEKTLEAWVRLDDLTQRGGGAISIQYADGSRFDAIVFGEREPGRWMAGSNGFARTKPFGGGVETEANTKPVHFAIVYQKDGTITAYRDGLPYGKPYNGGAMQSYEAGKCDVLFGLRHGPATAGRMLKGTITRAKLYDRALSPEEVAASAGAESNYVSEEEIVARLADPQKIQRRTLSDGLSGIRSQLEKLESHGQPISVYANISRNPPPTHLLNRGNVLEPGEEVSAGGVSAIDGADFDLPNNAPDSARRTKLAGWITSAENPLFARVMANRLWHYHFGNGIVATPNDFGFSGGRPSHPELLDWLASEFEEQKWSLKAMHRLIVNSATYRQSSAMNAKAAAVDADNRLLWRMAPRRLEAEELRDAMLAISGMLNPEIGGPGYRDVREYKFKGSHFYDLIPQDQPEQFRRTLYRFSPRGARRTMLDVFDCPDPSAITPNRALTTTPLQSLSLMNNPLVLSLASAFAERLQREAGEDIGAQIHRAAHLIYGRPADDTEVELALTFIHEYGLPAYCRVLFNSNAFLYVR